MSKLSDVTLRSVKPTAKAQKLTDGKGLYLYVAPTGGMSWRLDYTFEGKRKTFTFGQYPSLSLAAVRTKATEAKEKIANGIDPGAQKQAVKAAIKAVTANSFEVVAREWVANQAHVWTPKHQRKVTSRLETYIFPLLGNKEVKDVTAPELLEAIRHIEARGFFETAHSTLNSCGQIFRFAVATGRGERDTAADLRGALKPVKVSNFASVKDPKEIAVLLDNIDQYSGNLIVRKALQVAPYVFVRPSELRCAKWAEFNLEAAEWRIPAERMKMRQVHIVPLASQVIDLLEELSTITGHTQFLFPSMRANTAPISDMTLLNALRRMGYSKDEMTVHGFRSMASTILNEQGFNRDWIERQLAHSEKNGVRASYNHAEYLPERRRMMAEWADYLDSLREGYNESCKTNI